MSSLARRHGYDITPDEPPVAPPRPIGAVAIENAVEGCVRETYAALLARWQAEHAIDPEVARVYQAIAEDEIRHAQLAWDVAAWIEPRLDAETHAALQLAREAAVSTLLREMMREVPADLVRRVGVPDGSTAALLIAALDARLWATAGTGSTAPAAS